jgi:hypothetical protein
VRIFLRPAAEVEVYVGQVADRPDATTSARLPQWIFQDGRILLHQTISRTCAAAASSVIGGPGSDFTAVEYCRASSVGRVRTS